jgi:hypothetical protein
MISTVKWRDAGDVSGAGVYAYISTYQANYFFSSPPITAVGLEDLSFKRLCDRAAEHKG